MANQVEIQIINDGPRNATVKVTGILDTSDLASTTIVDVANFAFDPQTFRLDHIDYSISDGIEVQLLWDATVDTPILVLAGRGRMSFCDFGGITNNSGAGRTGNINLLTEGWTAGTQIFTVVLELIKVGGL